METSNGMALFRGTFKDKHEFVLDSDEHKPISFTPKHTGRYDFLLSPPTRFEHFEANKQDNNNSNTENY